MASTCPFGRSTFPHQEPPMRSFMKILFVATVATLISFACVTDSSRQTATPPVILCEVAGSRTSPVPPSPQPEVMIEPTKGITISSPYRPKAHIYRGQLH